MTEPIVVGGTGLVCPAAVSVPELLAAAGGPTPAAAPAPGEPCAHRASWFDPVTYLGARGWKYLTPATRYLLAAAGLALTDAGVDPDQMAPGEMGAIVGTNFAAHAVVAGMDQVVIHHGAEDLSPAEAPNFSINIPASQVSMRWAMRAFNLSLTNPMVAGVEALLMMTSALRRGRARMGIAGAVEQYPGADVHPAASEGACCFTIELLGDVRRRGAAPRAEVAGGFSRFVPAPPRERWADLNRAFEPLVNRAAPGPLPYASLRGPSAFSSQVDEVCAARFSQAEIDLTRREYLGVDGDHFTVSALFQAAGLMAAYGGGLVVATSPHGHVAALLLCPMRL